MSLLMADTDLLLPSIFSNVHLLYIQQMLNKALLILIVNWLFNLAT